MRRGPPPRPERTTGRTPQRGAAPVDGVGRAGGKGRSHVIAPDALLPHCDRPDPGPRRGPRARPAAHADLLRPGATQSFPDIAGNINGKLGYTYDSASGLGVLQVNNAPSILAIGPNQSDEVYVNDMPGQARSETLQVMLDGLGQFRAGNPGNTFSMYGSVTVHGQTYSGLLLQGTPTGFGFAQPGGMPAGTAAFDVNVALTGGLLKEVVGPDAYIRIAPEIGSTFTGAFYQNFSGQKVWTNVRDITPRSPRRSPSPRPTPSSSSAVVPRASSGTVGGRGDKWPRIGTERPSGKPSRRAGRSTRPTAV